MQYNSPTRGIFYGLLLLYYLTLRYFCYIIRLQIPKIANLINPVCGMHKAHHPLSFNLDVGFIGD